jgi:hypothetical protein
MTQLREAMEDAGIRSPRERLRAIAVEALMEHGKTSWDEVERAVFQAVRRDLALVWQLMEPYRAMAMRRLLVDTARDIREADRAHGASHLSADDQVTRARSERGGGGQLIPDDQGQGVSPIPLSDAKREGYRKAAATISRRLSASMLDTFMLDGVPIGNWQAGAARAWARSTGRNVRFVEMLTANVPPLDPIRNWIDPDMAAEFWERTAMAA